ncbi:MAG TPA: hypothetical protein VM534_05900 [Thermoanaerobaculia bacterium]|nr:hypothetical protein [Thermoanaerobaculia bacterium]
MEAKLQLRELIRQYEKRYTGRDGVQYHAQIWGRERYDGAWEGWIEFHPLVDTELVLSTAVETMQITRSRLSRWAAGMEPLYLEGALRRARLASS